MTMTMEEKFESLFVAKAALIKIHQRAVLQVWRNNILSTPTYLLCTNENKRLFLEIIIWIIRDVLIWLESPDAIIRALVCHVSIDGCRVLTEFESQRLRNNKVCRMKREILNSEWKTFLFSYIIPCEVIHERALPFVDKLVIDIFADIWSACLHTK